MTREISVMLEEGGAPCTTATVTLSDESATYGIRRADTDAMVVAAGTSVPHTSGGKYVYSFTTAVDGIAYEARVKIVWPNGDIEYADRPLVAVVETTLPTYLSVDEADAIADNLFGLTAWADASDADKLKALVTASARVDSSRRWQGRKYGLDEDGDIIEQELEFPRLDGSTPIAVDPNDPTSLVPIVPPKIEQAVVWEADSLLAGTRRARLAVQHDGLASQEIGSAVETYRPATNGQGVPILCWEADMLCSEYLLTTGDYL